YSRRFLFRCGILSLVSTIRPRPDSPLLPYTTLFRSYGRPAPAAGPDPALERLLEAALPAHDGRRAAQFRRCHGGTRRAESDHRPDRKSTRLNSSHVSISYAVFCLKKKI